jgi:hypothetical protein
MIENQEFSEHIKETQSYQSVFIATTTKIVILEEMILWDAIVFQRSQA